MISTSTPTRRQAWLKMQQLNSNKPGARAVFDFEVAACLPAYNEAENLKRLLPRLIKERALTEIVVIASGCTDNTVEVAQSFVPHVRVLVQEKREGKAAAINLFLQETTAPVILMVSTDTLPAIGSVPRLLKHFEDSEVGAVGSRPLPTNVPNSIMGISAHILWKAHHTIALKDPKIGEMVAWRRSGALLESATSVDEAFIEAQIVNQGLKVLYEPRAITYNHGPETFSDLLKQRKRIAIGHRLLKEKGYTVSTLDPLKGLLATLGATPKTFKGLAAWVVLTYAETIARLYATRNKNESTVWEIATSTKSI